MFLGLKLEFTSQLNPLPLPCNGQTILLFDLPHLCAKGLYMRETFADRGIKSREVNYLL